MKIILINLIILLVVTANAGEDNAEVKVTSYSRAGVRTRSAELCGKIINMKQPWVIVKVKVDANHKSPGNYTTIVGKEAKFCLAVVTQGGDAEVSLASFNGELLSENADLIKLSDKREL